MESSTAAPFNVPLRFRWFSSFFPPPSLALLLPPQPPARYRYAASTAAARSHICEFVARRVWGRRTKSCRRQNSDSSVSLQLTRLHCFHRLWRLINRITVFFVCVFCVCLLLLFTCVCLYLKWLVSLLQQAKTPGEQTTLTSNTCWGHKRATEPLNLWIAACHWSMFRTQ